MYHEWGGLMAIQEKVDPVSGAILFKKDKESITLKQAVVQIEKLQKTIISLEKRLKKLEKANKTSE